MRVAHAFKAGRHGWVHVVRGSLTLNGEQLVTGDGAALSDVASLELVAASDTELLLFDLS